MIRVNISQDKYETELTQMKKMSDEMVNNCMQCGKCTAGCPSNINMDILPHQVIRFLQLGQFDKVINSDTIWNCASCLTCASRCPRGVDLTKILEATRLITLRKKGNNRYKPENVAKMMIDDEMPQQAIMSAFRKYSK